MITLSVVLLYPACTKHYTLRVIHSASGRMISVTFRHARLPTEEDEVSHIYCVSVLRILSPLGHILLNWLSTPLTLKHWTLLLFSTTLTLLQKVINSPNHSLHVILVQHDPAKTVAVQKSSGHARYKS